MLKKLLFIFVITLVLSLSSVSTIKASMLSVGKDGKITWKVLSEQSSFDKNVPSHSYIEVKKVGDGSVDPKTSIEFSKKDEKVNLLVNEGSKFRQIDITGSDTNLIEIEERAELQRISIGVRNGEFSLLQKGILALTQYPIKIDPVTANLSLGTKTGEKYLSILPYQAVEGVMRSKIITRLEGDRLEIIDEEKGLQYKFAGEKVFNILNFYEYKIPVSLKVSASTGEVLSIEGPTWYKIIGFFLS